MNRSLPLLALAGLSVAVLNALRRRHQQRLAATPKAKPEVLQTWEGEGGGLRDGGPFQTVSPRAPVAEPGPKD